MEKRRQAIRDIVNQLGEVNFTQLRELFPEVSDVTLRKDLKFLDETQQLIRVHGGAKSLPHVLNFHYRSTLHREEKQLIATKAAKLINPHDSLFITSGTTCVELASVLPAFPLYVFTDGLNTAASFPFSPDINVEIFGGEVDLNVMRIGGSSVLNALETCISPPPSWAFPVSTRTTASPSSPAPLPPFSKRSSSTRTRWSS